MEQYRRRVLEAAAEWPVFGTSQIKESLSIGSSPQVTPILDWLVRHAYVKKLDPVFGPNGWERAWAVTQSGRRFLAGEQAAA